MLYKNDVEEQNVESKPVETHRSAARERYVTESEHAIKKNMYVVEKKIEKRMEKNVSERERES